MKITDLRSLNKNPTDPRLRSEKFRQTVRMVFDYLDIENTGRNFKKFDKIIDWMAFNQNILYPTQTARAEIIREGLPTKGMITTKLPGRTRSEAIKNLDEKRYRFIEWRW